MKHTPASFRRRRRRPVLRIAPFLRPNGLSLHCIGEPQLHVAAAALPAVPCELMSSPADAAPSVGGVRGQLWFLQVVTEEQVGCDA